MDRYLVNVCGIVIQCLMLVSPTKVTIWEIMRAKRASNEYLSYCYLKEIGILSDLTLNKIGKVCQNRKLKHKKCKKCLKFSIYADFLL